MPQAGDHPASGQCLECHLVPCGALSLSFRALGEKLCTYSQGSGSCLVPRALRVKEGLLGERQGHLRAGEWKPRFWAQHWFSPELRKTVPASLAARCSRDRSEGNLVEMSPFLAWPQKPLAWPPALLSPSTANSETIR